MLCTVSTICLLALNAAELSKFTPSSDVLDRCNEKIANHLKMLATHQEAQELINNINDPIFRDVQQSGLNKIIANTTRGLQLAQEARQLELDRLELRAKKQSESKK